MKKLLFALVAAAALLVGCQPKPVLVSNITLSQTTGSIVEGETLHLSAIVSPKEASNPELTWSSSNTSVATVNGSGDITAVAPGSAKITAAAVDGSGVTASCEITVVKKVIPVSKIDLNETAYTLKKDETLQLTAVITPNDATYQTVTWTSDNPDVATVDANGKVTAKAAGEAKITATSTEGIVSNACVVTVVEPKPMFVQYPSCLLRTGGKITQKVYYGTVDAYKDREEATELTWASDNTSVATVEGGVVTSVAPGKATITATDAMGTSIQMIVNVEDKPARTYDEYLPGVSLFDCTDATLPWNKSMTAYSLKEGFVENTQCMGATIKGYKIAELFFPKAVDASKIQNPALFMRVYISDPSKLTTNAASDQPYVEIRSTGKTWNPSVTDWNDIYQEEPKTRWVLQDIFANWDGAKPSAKQTLVAGWNNIVLPISKAFVHGSDLSAITYFRIYQLPGYTYNEVEWRFDQIRIIDWTEFERCDNFAMWRDRPAQQNQYQYVNDTEGKIEGTSCVACQDVLFSAVNSYRLEMWPGLEYAMPAMYDYNDLKLQLKFYVEADDVKFFNECVHFRVELGKKGFRTQNDAGNWVWGFTPDNNAIEMGIGATTDKPLNIQAGWNTMTFNFSDFAGSIVNDFNIRQLGYFRIILSPVADAANQVGYRTYKLDDIRILEK